MKRPPLAIVAVCLTTVLFAYACAPRQNDTRLTTARCLKMGGSIAGDIGDGRIYRSDYLCESGERPIGPIEFVEGERIPVEGAVCCGNAE
ncbi:MAG: hypothetical protein AAFX56_00725 [Pseudomonadota bacterium]